MLWPIKIFWDEQGTWQVQQTSKRKGKKKSKERLASNSAGDMVLFVRDIQTAGLKTNELSKDEGKLLSEV